MQNYEKEEMLKSNTILKIQTGSHLYGTNTPTSDVDYSGIFIADENYYFGLKNITEIDNSVVSKSETGKNTFDAIDDKLYEIKKFVNLALQNNPNIIEHLFVNDKNIIFCNEYGKILLNSRHLFPYKGAFEKFIGYATSQKHKMIIKEKNFTELHLALNYFETQESHAYLMEYKEKSLSFLQENSNYFVIGDLNFQKHVQVKKVVSILKERLSKISNRYDLVTKYGYDTKFGSHLIRLLFEGRDLLKNHELVFPLPESELILDIKNGKYTIEQLLKLADDLENEMKELKNLSTLPDAPLFNEINDITKKITKSFHGF